jgi:hypothetical protein
MKGFFSHKAHNDRKWKRNADRSSLTELTNLRKMNSRLIVGKLRANMIYPEKSSKVPQLEMPHSFGTGDKVEAVMRRIYLTKGTFYFQDFCLIHFSEVFHIFVQLLFSILCCHL